MHIILKFSEVFKEIYIHFTKHNMNEIKEFSSSRTFSGVILGTTIGRAEGLSRSGKTLHLSDNIINTVLVHHTKSFLLTKFRPGKYYFLSFVHFLSLDTRTYVYMYIRKHFLSTTINTFYVCYNKIFNNIIALDDGLTLANDRTINAMTTFSL